MTDNTEALRLADWLDGHSNGPLDNKHNAAAELRRLHALNAELVEALRAMLYDDDHDEAKNMARAALAKVEASK